MLNISDNLLHSFDELALLTQFQAALDRIRTLHPRLASSQSETARTLFEKVTQPVLAQLGVDVVSLLEHNGQSTEFIACTLQALRVNEKQLGLILCKIAEAA